MGVRPNRHRKAAGRKAAGPRRAEAVTREAAKKAGCPSRRNSDLKVAKKSEAIRSGGNRCAEYSRAEIRFSDSERETLLKKARCPSAGSKAARMGMACHPRGDGQCPEACAEKVSRRGLHRCSRWVQRESPPKAGLT